MMEIEEQAERYTLNNVSDRPRTSPDYAVLIA